VNAAIRDECVEAGECGAETPLMIPFSVMILLCPHSSRRWTWVGMEKSRVYLLPNLLYRCAPGKFTPDDVELGSKKELYFAK
jgi:hypothetical protein